MNSVQRRKSSSDVYTSNVDHDIDINRIIQELTESFSELEIKKVVGFTKNALGGEFLNFPDDQVGQCFEELRRQGRISSDNTELLGYYAENTSKNSSVKKKIEQLNHSRRKNKQGRGEFVGREEDVDAIIDSLASRRASVINLHGDAGVGKTTLAEQVAEIMESKNVAKFQGKVDLRRMKDQGVLCLGILHAFNSPNLLNPSVENVYEVIEKLEVNSILILDNAEDFLDESPENNRFCNLLRLMVEHDKDGKLTMLLTSRVPLPIDTKNCFSDYYVKPLEQTSSVKVFDSTNLFLSTSKKNEISWLCKNKPLNLKLIRGIMEEKLLKPEDVRANLEKKNTSETANLFKQSEESIYDGNVISEAFNKCTPEMKNVVIKLSLFQRPFSVLDAQKMLEQSYPETTFFLCTLKNRGFLHKRGNEQNNVTYEIHPLINKFLTDKGNDKNYQEVYSKAKEIFCKAFLQKAKEVCRLLEKDYLKAYSVIEMERLNLLLAFQISFEMGFLHFSSDFRDISIIVDLFRILAPGQEREQLFEKWCTAAHKQGEWIIYANLASRQILVLLEKSTRKYEAQQLLCKVEEALSKITVKSFVSYMYSLTKSSYYYAKAGIAYSICLSKELNVWESAAREALHFYKKSLEIREEVLKDHTDTARTLNAIGNCLMQLEDLYWALQYYTGAFAMRRRLTGSDMHPDMPVYMNQIASVHERMGNHYLKKVRLGASPSQRKELTKLYKQEFYTALTKYQGALDLEKKLHVSGYINTATFYRNMSNIYAYLDEGDLSLKTAKKALSLRKKVLSVDSDTIRSYYQVGLAYEKLCKGEQSLKYFYKAYMMEQRLPRGERSAVKEHVLSKIQSNLGSTDEAESYDKRHKEAMSKGDLDDTVMTSADEDDDINSCEPTYSGSSSETAIKDSYLFRQSFTIDVQQGSYELPGLGILLEWPPNAVTCPTKIEFREISTPFCPSPAKNNETLVSCIVRLGPSNVELQEPIKISISHSGASLKDGYETVAKTFDGEISYEWSEVLTEKSSAQECGETNYVVQVKVDKLAAVAVVSRLVTDHFKVGEKGCVVRSSVCNKVTVEFPEGAVDRTVNGSMKLLLMPDHIDILDGVNAYPCPMLSIEGFEDIGFRFPVKIKLPHPYPAGFPSHGVRLLCMGGLYEWEDITDKVQCMEHESFIEIQVRHFSKLWAWIYEAPLTVVSSFAQYLFGAPQEVCFGIFKEKMMLNVESLTMKLICIPNHEKFEKRALMEDEGYTRLAFSTGNKTMRPGDRAYTRVEGCYQKKIKDDIFLQFIENDMCIKELPLQRKRNKKRKYGLSDGDVVISFSTKKDLNVENKLCTFCISETIIHMESFSEFQNVQSVGLESALPGSSGLPFVDSEQQSTSESGGDASCQEMVEYFGLVDIKSIGTDIAIAKVWDKLQLNKHSVEDPPEDVVQKCRYFCQICKKQGRLDIVKELRTKLPSGTTGPLLDGNTLVKHLDFATKKKFSRELTATDEWKAFAQKAGVTKTDIEFYDKREKNPVLTILDEHCGDMTIEVIYDHLSKSNAGAVADNNL